MADYIDHCLNEGLMTPSEYFDLIEAGEDDIDDPVICVHEAGHAVVAYVLGRPIDYVSAWELGEDDGIETAGGGILHIGSPSGLTRYADEPKVTGAELAARLYRDVVTVAGGPLAQHIYTGEAIESIMRRSLANADPNSSSDWHLINNDWICTYGDIMFPEPPFEMPEEEWTDDDFRRFLEWQGEKTAEVERKLWIDAERIVRENWDMVSGLATVLVHNMCLDGLEAYKVFDRVKARRAA